MQTREIESLFYWIESQHTRNDGQITLEDLRAALHIDLDGDGQINGEDELRIIDQNVAAWVANMHADEWADESLTLAEFTAMLRSN